MEENEYIPKSSIKPAVKTEEPSSSRAKKQADEPQRPKDTKKEPSKEGSSLLNLKDRLNLSKIKILLGRRKYNDYVQTLVPKEASFLFFRKKIIRV